MKRAYEKPEIIFESFVMSTNIAGDCEEPFITSATRDACGIKAEAAFPGMEPQVVFTIGLGNCTANGNGSEMHNGLCYHNPTDNNNLFNS